MAESFKGEEKIKSLVHVKMGEVECEMEEKEEGLREKNSHRGVIPKTDERNVRANDRSNGPCELRIGGGQHPAEEDSQLLTPKEKHSNAESKKNLQCLLGSYYSSEEDGEGEESEGTSEKINLVTGSNQNRGEDKEEDQNNCSLKNGSANTEGKKGENIVAENSSNGEDTDDTDEEDADSSDGRVSAKEANVIGKSARQESPQRTCHNVGTNQPMYRMSKGNYDNTTNQHSISTNYSVAPINSTYNASQNYQHSNMGPKEISSGYLNYQAYTHGKAHPSYAASYHHSNNRAAHWSPYSHGGNQCNNFPRANRKPEKGFNHLGFSLNKEMNVDLTNIPVVNQREIISNWKPEIVQEEKRSKKYNIKTKVYNATNNTFDNVIIHGKNQKRKHQINWLAKEAVEKEYELMQNTNYSKRRTANDKYGW
ncbi:conserved Plasmodium protein, unknown function [Plasmodium ovale wallikeri]|uniref:Uncharacterized protein n=2 Tax=Plasmodium ovale TaxID=36330 RepID=A0A1A8Z723_PLAOA|nr:conserved Plasmodium protein, unknown function [Plasmodium ovale wallikeri]SBT40152.1 conserved Plasmodium protein, unknown function [Plasmodium ovale wallikeri]SBT77916.1 conserved Plasmodium protein, unknown function [Plasmodium ovale]